MKQRRQKTSACHDRRRSRDIDVVIFIDPTQLSAIIIIIVLTHSSKFLTLTSSCSHINHHLKSYTTMQMIGVLIFKSQ